MVKSFGLNTACVSAKLPESPDPEFSGQFMSTDLSMNGDLVNIDFEDPEDTAKIVLHLDSALSFVRDVAVLKQIAEVPVRITATVTDTDVTIEFVTGDI